MFFIKVGLRPWRIAPFSQMLNSLTIGFLLCCLGFVTWAQKAFLPIIDRIKHEQVVTVYLQPPVTVARQNQLAETLKVQLGASPTRTIEVEVSSEEGFIQKLKDQYPSLAQEVISLGRDVSNVVPKYITLSGRMSSEAISGIEKLGEVESVVTSQHRFSLLLHSLTYLRWMTLSAGVVLALVLLFCIFQFVRIHSFWQADAVELIRLFGGHSLKERLPGLWSGACLGVAGGVVAVTAWSVLAPVVSAKILHLFPETEQAAVTVSVLPLIVLFLSGALTGAVSGFFAGGTASR